MGRSNDEERGRDYGELYWTNVDPMPRRGHKSYVNLDGGGL